MTRRTVYVTIGNSDDKLPQAKWSEFCSRLQVLAASISDTRFGPFYTAPGAPYQSMCVAFLEPDTEMLDHLLTDQLPFLAHMYGQDSIAVVMGDVQLIGAGQ